MQLMGNYALLGAVIFVLGLLAPRIVRGISGKVRGKTLTCPANETYHIVQLHQKKGNSFWFRVNPERKADEGTISFKLSKSNTYVAVLLLANGNYEYRLIIKGHSHSIQKDWRAQIESYGYPVKGYPDVRELDSIYGYQARRRAARRKAAAHP